jgi:hypothetical protein
MNSINPHWIVVDIEPSIALARAECLQKYRAHSAEKPRAFDAMKGARAAHALMRRFMNSLVSSLSLKFPASLQTSAERPRQA